MFMRTGTLVSPQVALDDESGLLHAIRRIPRSLQLADIKNLPGVICVVRANVRNGRRSLG